MTRRFMFVNRIEVLNFSDKARGARTRYVAEALAPITNTTVHVLASPRDRPMYEAANRKLRTPMKSRVCPRIPGARSS